MRERLRFLYGEEAGRRVYAELRRLLDGRPGRASRTSSPAGAFDQGDVLLITYGDSVLAERRPPLAGLEAFATRHLAGLFSGIHVLPFFPYSSDYGFAVLDYLRVDEALGDWAAVGALGARFDLMFDFVLNHVSAQSSWFQGYLRQEAPYDGYFISVDPATDLAAVTRPRTTPLLTRFETWSGPRWVWTTFGPDQVDLDYRNPAVLLHMVEVMLDYVDRGARLLRLDAVGYLWKEVGTSCLHLPQTHEVVKLLRDVLDEVAPEVAIVTETNVPHEDNVRYFGDGGDEAQMVYQFPLAPLVLDAFARGDATRLGAWIETLRTPSTRTAFFNFLASHDGVGVVPARGLLGDEEVAELARLTLAHGGQVSYRTGPGGSESAYELNSTFFDALSDPRDAAEPWRLRRDRFLCSQAVMLALAGVPAVYVHSLFGSHNDQAAYARSGWKRDLNHGRLRLADIDREAVDPDSHPGQVFRRYAELLRVRRAQPAFHPQAAQRVVAADPGVLALERGPRQGQRLLALHNLTAAPRSLALGPRGPWRDLLGGGAVLGGGEACPLEPYQVRWLTSSE